MRFCHSVTFSALILVYLFSDNALGAPPKGRYMSAKCTPDKENANCIENKGPLMDLPGRSQRSSRSNIKNMVPVTSSEESSETEESGDGSGDLNLPALTRKQRDNGPEEWLQQVQNVEEGTSGESDYSNYVVPEPVKPKLSAEDLQEDNVIE